MIFTGDISLPFEKAIKCDFIKIFKNKQLFSNLEGAIVNNTELLKSKSIVFNNEKAIKDLIHEIKFAGFALANNHILDAGSLSQTLAFLKKNDIPYCGIGRTLKEASRPLILVDNGLEIVILNFGWEVIQCEVTDGDYIGVNPLRRAHVLATVKKAVVDYPNAKVIAYMHWSYELESEPQPVERELAKKLIDMGVAGVIGAHPHRIGGFETYKEKPIVYSLGNWLFKQNYYFDGKLKFPDFCNQELAFEWDFENNNFKFHFFNYDREESTLTFSHTEYIDSPTMAAFTPFRDLSNEEYKKWYKRNHYHRKKGLPVYYWEDSEISVRIKNKINRLRDSLLHLVLKLR